MAEHRLHRVKPMEMYPEPPANKKELPRITLNFETLPEGKEWEVGKTYELHLVVRQVGQRIERDGKGEAAFEITKAGGSHQRSNKRFYRK